MGIEENQSVGTPSSAIKRKRKLCGDSDDDDEDDEDSDDQAEDEDDEEEEEMKKVKKVETYDEVRRKIKKIDPSSKLTVAGFSLTFTVCFVLRMKWNKPPVWRSWRSR